MACNIRRNFLTNVFLAENLLFDRNCLSISDEIYAERFTKNASLPHKWLLFNKRMIFTVQITTVVTTETGAVAWISAGVLCFVSCCCLAWIPLLLPNLRVDKRSENTVLIPLSNFPGRLSQVSSLQHYCGKIQG